MIELTTLPKILQDYCFDHFSKMVEELETGMQDVLVFDKNTNTHFEKHIFRKYKSYGQIPDFDSKHPKSYMFSDKSLAKNKVIPEIFAPIINYIKALDSRYNQFVFNLYSNGSNYIEPHSDCDKHMCTNYKILILSLGQTRTLLLSKRDKTQEIKQIIKNNDIIYLTPYLNKEFRHCILPDNSVHPRISITARQMVKDK